MNDDWKVILATTNKVSKVVDRVLLLHTMSMKE